MLPSVNLRDACAVLCCDAVLAVSSLNVLLT